MSPQIGRAAFSIAIFIVIMGCMLLPSLERDSAEFVVTVLSIGIGLVMILLVAVLARLGRH